MREQAAVKEMTFKDFKKILQNRARNEIRDEKFKPSAVLIPLYEKGNELHTIVTLRPQNMKNHQGQFAFPGGVRDAGDKNFEETALREAEEEVGLKREHVKILGILDDIITPTHYRIVPVVGTIPCPYAFTPSAREIDKILEVELSALCDVKNFREQTGQTVDGYILTAPFFDYNGHTIWGATGRMLKQLLFLLYGWKPQ